MPSDDNISRERLEAPPGEVYTKTIQKPTFEFKREHYFDHLIKTNKAWTVMLVEIDQIPREHGAQILAALSELGEAGADVLGEYDPNLEYFFSHVEHQLNERVGEDIAGDINIGRTRPEPLARMATREYLLETLDRVNSLRSTLLDIAEREVETIMPQWTHYQQAQISTVGHYLMGIVDSLERDVERLLSAYDTVNQCTLGCGALAGSSYALDRQLIADLLGFDGYKENTIDCVSGGDHHMEPASALSDMMVTLSRLSNDLYTWHTWEFAFVEIGDEFSGSSSMMPQKKNPYPFEYIEDAAATTIANVTAVHEVLHNTPFQDVKHVEEGAVAPLYEALDDVIRMIRLLEGTLASAEFKAEEMLNRAAEGFASCTELAATIHRQTDLSYRTAHRIVGDLVLRSLRQGLDAMEVGADLVNESAQEVIGKELDIDDATVREALDPTAFVEVHNIPGGPAPREVRRMIADRRATLDADRVAVNDRHEQIERASQELAESIEEIAG